MNNQVSCSSVLFGGSSIGVRNVCVHDQKCLLSHSFDGDTVDDVDTW